MITRKNFLTLAGSSLVLTIVACGDDETSGAGGAGSGASGGSSNNSSSGTGTNTTTNMGGSGGNPAGTGGAGTGGSAGDCAGDINALISLNHTAAHTLTIPVADILLGMDQTYDTGGAATHCHRVNLTAADFTTLQNGGTVTKVSCNGGDHEYVISCAANPPQPTDPMCAQNDNTGTCN